MLDNALPFQILRKYVEIEPRFDGVVESIVEELRHNRTARQNDEFIQSTIFSLITELRKGSHKRVEASVLSTRVRPIGTIEE